MLSGFPPIREWIGVATSVFAAVIGLKQNDIKKVLAYSTVSQLGLMFAALGLGANVKVFDNSLSRLRRLQNDIGTRIYTSVIQPKVLAKALMRADVAIGALRAPLGRTPCIVTEEMVREMKQGSVIVDVSIDSGGCFETSEITTHENPTYTKYDVIHYCVPNIASNVSRTASYALSNILAPMLRTIAQMGGIEQSVRINAGLRHGLYLYKGMLTKEFIAEKFELKYTDLNLILSSEF